MSLLATVTLRAVKPFLNFFCWVFSLILYIEKKDKGNCEANVNCHNSLGQEEGPFWNEEFVVDSAKKELSEAQDPRELTREKNSGFVGLKNLGATCYMNTLLQALFMDEPFRRNVLKWKAEGEKGGEGKKGGEEKKRCDSVILELQRLFAFLIHSDRKSFNPVALTKLLNLQTNVQEDTEEFSRLFLSFLEDNFSVCKNSEVREAVKRYEGSSVFFTKCSTCSTCSKFESSFKDLSLPLQSGSVWESLLHLFSPETLEAENMYQCPSCNSKQPAKRVQKITALPQVLQLQLSRFYFELSTLSKKKNKSEVHFPLFLDMNPFLLEPTPQPNTQQTNNVKKEEKKEDSRFSLPLDPFPTNATSKRKRVEKEERECTERKNNSHSLYQLTSILIHRGDSANGGHYVAHIYNLQSFIILFYLYLFSLNRFFLKY